MREWLPLPDRRDEARQLAHGDAAGRGVLRVLAEDTDEEVRDGARRALGIIELRSVACSALGP